MITATDIRKDARQSLAGKWSIGAVITLIYFVIGFSIAIIQVCAENLLHQSALAFVISLFDLIITPPMSLGLVFSFMKLKRNEDVGFFDFLTLGFSNFAKSWKVYFMMFVKLLIPAVITFVGIFWLNMSIVISISRYFTIHLSSILLPLLVVFAGSIMSYVVSLSISLSMNVAYDEPQLTGSETVNRSIALMKGNKGNLFVLTLSFIGWAFLASLTFGIGLFWLFPYMQVSFVCFYDTIRNNNNTINE